MKTLGVSENVHKELMNIKINYGYKKTDNLIEEMIREFRKEKLIQASLEFRKKMKEKRMSLRNVVGKSRKIREEIYSEWFA